MSKDSKQSMDPFTAELEKASLKDIQEAIIWKLGDIVKSSETIAELKRTLRGQLLSQGCAA